RHPVQLQQLLVLLHQRVLGLRQDVHQCALVQFLQRGDDRQPADELRDHPELEQVLRLHVPQQLRQIPLLLGLHVRAEPQGPPARRSMICSSPPKAPPQMKRMLVVSTCRNSCCGCLRPPLGGTLAMVPSMILSSACCTPSPDTSRVMEGFSLLRAILSISSM